VLSAGLICSRFAIQGEDKRQHAQQPLFSFMIYWLAGKETGPHAFLTTDAVALGLAQAQPPTAIASKQHTSVH
jgi:hypothetical protein